MNDWRLPTVQELLTIVDSGKTAPAFDTDYFFISDSDILWTSDSSNTAINHMTFALSSNNGVVSSVRNSTASGQKAMCVRGQEPVPSSYLSTTINGTTVVRDTTTGFLWQNDSLTDKTWKEAMQYCEDLSSAGYSDWRLPNRNELASLCNPFSMPEMLSAAKFWSSTTDNSNSESAWTVHFRNSTILLLPSDYIISDIKTNLHNVKCMRSDNYLGYCGDGILQNGFETCEPIESPAEICSRINSGYSHYGNNYIWQHTSVNGREAYCPGHNSTIMIVHLSSPTTVSVYGIPQNTDEHLTILQNGSQLFTSQGNYGSWTDVASSRYGTLYLSYSHPLNSSSSMCISFSSAPSSIEYSNNSNMSSNPSTRKCGNDCRPGSGECYKGWCGDGIVQSPYEFCDSGSSQNNDNWSQSRHCNSTCTGWAPYCGDGFINGGEACEPSSFTSSQCYGDIHKEECGGGCGSEYIYHFSVYQTACSSECRITTGALTGSRTTDCGQDVPSPQCNY